MKYMYIFDEVECSSAQQQHSCFFCTKTNTPQSLTGKYREILGKPCNENRDPAMRTGFPCNESRVFPLGIDLQGFPVSYTGFGFTVQIQIMYLGLF